MNASMPRLVGLVSVLLASGCTRVGPLDSLRLEQEPSVRPTEVTSIPTTPNRDANPPPGRQPRHHATVVTDAGRIEASSVDGHLTVDVQSAAGWSESVERGDDDTRIVWTSGTRSVEVRLRTSSTGISQEVVATG